MPEGGVLHFATKPVRIEDDPELDDGDYIELTISDTGVGMSEDVAMRAFEPFFTTKEIGKGTGLGLSMVYGMARQSGGTARIETEIGAGTSVKLFFKAAGELSEAALHPLEEETHALRPENASVLVIDDDPDVRGFVAEALTDEGYKVRSCADGKSGLKAFAEERPELVVLDFIMPNMSGADVAKEMLSEAPGQRILFVSGYSETDVIKQVAPDSPLLPKPFRSEALCKAVRSALS
jgi:CheY-like chemotaxis protein